MIDFDQLLNIFMFLLLNLKIDILSYNIYEFIIYYSNKLLNCFPKYFESECSKMYNSLGDYVRKILIILNPFLYFILIKMFLFFYYL